MTEEANIISNLITVSPVVGVLIYFILYFQKVIKAYKIEIEKKEEEIKKLYEEKTAQVVEVVTMAKDLNTTLEKLVDKIAN